MQTDDTDKLIPLTTDRSIWDRFFGVFPLVIVGSKERDGRYNLAPKHLAMPLGWENHHCFVCSPGHTTYHNIRRHGVFMVSYPRPTEVLLASLAAAPVRGPLQSELTQTRSASEGMSSRRCSCWSATATPSGRSARCDRCRFASRLRYEWRA